MWGLNSATFSFQNGGMLGKIKLTFQIDLIEISLENKMSRIGTQPTIYLQINFIIFRDNIA